MNPEILEKVLGCRKLPSLPAVAMRVVELTQSDKVSMKDLAETIQNDQALTAKILRTVNSSLFGLRQKCSSINQAIVMLGLSAVKTLALGFSLVTAINDASSEFDLTDHWRRALFTGVAAKAIAARAGLANQEECFLGGLLQDLGMVALVQTMGPEYLEIVDRAGGDHRQVCKFELEALQLQHPDLGALLAQRWRLPDELVMPIKYHEHPTAAPTQYLSICRAVGLGNIAADVLISTDAAGCLRRFYSSAERWFGFDTDQADDVLKKISASAREVAKLLSVPTGPVADADQVIAAARDQMQNLQVTEQPPPVSLTPPDEIVDSESVDELTGAASRAKFDQTLVAAFEQARSGVGPLAVAIFDLDGLEKLNKDHGRDAGDTVLVVTAARMRQAFAPVNGLVCRFDGGRFAVIMPRTDRTQAVKVTEAARLAIAKQPVKLIAARSGSPPEISVTVSVGVACVDQATMDRFDDTSDVLQITEMAAKAAKRAGRDTMRVYAPTRSIAA